MLTVRSSVNIVLDGWIDGWTDGLMDGQTKLTHTCHMARSKKILATRVGTVGAFMIWPKLCALVGVA